MRPYLVPALMLSLVATGCGPVSLFYREGASVDTVARARTACQTDALAKAPNAPELRQRAPVLVPGYGGYYGGYWVDGGFYTVDANAGLRGELVNQCMADKGYSRVNLDRCSGGPATIPGTMPSLNAGACAQQVSDGSWRVAVPG